VTGEWDREENTMEEDDEDDEEVVEEDEDDEDCGGRWEEEEQEEEGPHQQDHVDVTNMMFFSTSHTLFEVIEQQTSVTSKLYPYIYIHIDPSYASTPSLLRAHQKLAYPPRKSEKDIFSVSSPPAAPAAFFCSPIPLPPLTSDV
jgi:hypothetical protein